MNNHFFYSLNGPLDSMPVERQMRIANLHGFADLVRRVRADPRSILERHEIDPWLIQDPDHYIECQSLVDVLEYCSKSFNDSLFGLHLAQLQDPDVYGCVAALCRSAPRVREAITSFVDFLPVIHAPDSILELVEGKDIAELRWRVRTDLGLNNQAHYQAVLLNLKLLKQVGGKAFRPSYVNLAVDIRPKDIAELENQLGCAFRKNATENAVAFPTALLDQPVATSSRLLFKLLGGYLGQVKVAGRKTIVERVEDYVRGALPSRNCSIERCARKLGISVRTLQANLSDCGLRFSDIVGKYRVDLAKIYLQQDQLSLDDLAASLGYSEQSSFGRAFKRWTGLTPKLYRQRFTALPDSSS